MSKIWAVVVNIWGENMMTSSNGIIFCVTGHLCGEFTGPRRIPPYKGQWRGALMLSLICTWTNDWVNYWDAGDLQCHRTHYDITVMFFFSIVGVAVHSPCEVGLNWQSNTVECHYNMVQYCKILHKWLQELRKNINQILDPQKHFIPRPNGGVMGCLLWIFVKNQPRYNGTALYIAPVLINVLNCIPYLLCFNNYNKIFYYEASNQ